MNLNQVYEKLRRQAERSGNEIDEDRLRRQAWAIRDRMLFEQSLVMPSSSAPGAGAGGRLVDKSTNNYVEDGYIDNYFE